MIVARRKEREYFETSPDYGHLASKMGAEYLAKLLSKVFFHLLFLVATVNLTLITHRRFGLLTVRVLILFYFSFYCSI